ncbi:uncharacterized protein LOC115386230 [Salarias fasciatus]|uniref:Uncharacterized LOC115386230 n=1 Tax=Salarias fasciatus TaxID=181472 RepID=A0A672JN14_SALFA|nr:uncharacterized protein LOC115386230 [Salarias fasciatus]
MPSGGRMSVKRKISAKDWNSSKTHRAVMEDHSTTPSFSSLHQHRHRPSVTLSLPAFEGSEAGYSPSLLAQDSLQTLFSASNSLSGSRRGRSGGEKAFHDVGGGGGGGGADRDSSLGDRLDRECGPGGYFDDLWYGSGEKDAWDDGESGDSPADHLHGDGNTNGFYRTSCAGEEGLRRRAAAEYDSSAAAVYNREANSSCFPNKQTGSYCRGGAGTINDGGSDHCWNLRVIDRYLGKKEDYGPSCGSGEDQAQAAEVPWLSVSPSDQGAGRWTEEAENYSLTSACRPQASHMGRTYTQKLDSFSEAFFSQRKRRVPFLPAGDSTEQIWDVGEGGGETPGPDKSKQSCALGSDPYMLPSSSSSSSSPAHLFLPSFPSPPPSSHFMPSVLSPPPTPLPPPSHSPSKLDSPQCGAAPQGGEPLGTLQFFMPHLQSVPSVHPAGMIWKFPVMPHCFPQSAGDAKGPHADDGSSITATHDVLQSVHPTRALCSSSSPSLHTSLHVSSRSPQLSGQRHQGAGHTVSQKAKRSPGSLNQTHLQKPASLIFTGTTFPSVLHSGGGQTRSRYTPRPLLNPQRTGTGLYCSLTPLQRGEEAARGEEEEQSSVLPRVNVGPDFQADLPDDAEWPEVWTPEEKSTCEQLLWKPSEELEENENMQDQVEKLLSMCSSSCLPGGGSNTELALHCLHYCQGNTMATLEMLLFSQHSPAGDYHYSGCDFWTDTEKSVFSAAMETYGKDFSLIQKMVKTKTVCQCVEFYYLGKKLQDKQKKQEEESREEELEQQKRAAPKCQPVNRPFVLEEVVPVPPLASFFPCKLCGKMFYKIKSRNAHMKIHRQPQEDWSERRLQHQLFTQRLGLGHPGSLMPIPGTNLPPPQTSALILPHSGLGEAPSSNGNSDDVHHSVINSNLVVPPNAGVLNTSTALSFNKFTFPSSNVICADGSDSDQRDPVSVLPFHQSWGSLGHQADLAAVYSNPKGKEHVGAGTAGGNESITWQ